MPAFWSLIYRSLWLRPPDLTWRDLEACKTFIGRAISHKIQTMTNLASVAERVPTQMKSKQPRYARVPSLACLFCISYSPLDSRHLSSQNQSPSPAVPYLALFWRDEVYTVRPTPQTIRSGCNCKSIPEDIGHLSEADFWVSEGFPVLQCASLSRDMEKGMTLKPKMRLDFSDSASWQTWQFWVYLRRLVIVYRDVWV